MPRQPFRRRRAGARPRRARRKRRRAEALRHRFRPRTAGARFAALVAIMQTLRSTAGCPWDREQTLASLKPFVLEETYEVLDAIDAGDFARLREEIGDFLFEAVFLAQICAEEGRFTIAESIAAITDKLIRRHPHVFGRGKARRRVHTAERVLEQWEALKAAEHETPRGVLDGLPRTLPALLRAYEIGARAAAVGFDWVRAADIVDKIDEEVRELREALTVGHPSRAAEEMGDLLFAIANLSRKLGVEPEAALRAANDKFTARFAAMEQRLGARGRSVHDATLDEMEAEWQAVKKARVAKTED